MWEEGSPSRACSKEMLLSFPFWAETAAQLVEVEHLLLLMPLSPELFVAWRKTVGKIGMRLSS